MKLHITYNYYLFSAIAFLALTVVGVGCVHGISLKVVDGKTGEPISGVSAVWHEHASNLLTGKAHETGPTNLPPSGDDGVITIDNVHKDWANSLILSRLGYNKLYGNYSGEKIWLTERISTFPKSQFMPEQPDGFVLEQPITEANSTNGCFLIPMQSVNAH